MMATKIVATAPKKLPIPCTVNVETFLMMVPNELTTLSPAASSCSLNARKVDHLIFPAIFDQLYQYIEENDLQS